MALRDTAWLHVVAMVRRLLHFSRRGKLESRPVALKPLVNDSLRVLSHRRPRGVAVRSVPGPGTTVVVYLPARPDNAQHDAPAQPAQPPPESGDISTAKTVRGQGTGRPVILVADDEPVLLRSTQRLLARMKAYDVITAKDGQEAWQLYQAHAESIGVVLLDIHMPLRSGLEVCLLIRAQRPDAHVVLTSGAEIPDHPILSAAGISYLPKPYSEDQLRAAVLGAMVR